jgi:hypothetical protein
LEDNGGGGLVVVKTPVVKFKYKKGKSRRIESVWIDGVQALYILLSSNRRCFATAEYVLKAFDADWYKNDIGNWFSAWESGHPLQQNRKEIDIWRRVKRTKSARHFAPVIKSARGGQWLLMKRVMSDKSKAKPAYVEAIGRLEKKYKFDSEGQYKNIKGVPVIYDYGLRRR